MASTGSFVHLIVIFLLFWELCLTLGCGNDSLEDSEPRIRIKDGWIKGVYENDVAAFLGIPYAEPPIGNRRFQKSIPIDPWTGVFIANRKPPPCMQYTDKRYDFIPTSTPSEDCLYLNVWTPVKNCCKTRNHLHVLVWIYGGAYAFGSTDIEIYDGRILASSGDVVVVSMNYRVGIFGFLDAGIEDAPGNMGLGDQNLAMRWVRENIHHFGGDRNKITVFGESAGSISISLHLIAPLSQNLFKRAIMESGSAFLPECVDPPSEAFKRGKTIAEMVGCSNGTDPFAMVHCLKMADAMALSVAESEKTSEIVMYFRPSYGNWYLPTSPIKSYLSGDIQQVDVIMGDVKDEGSLFLNFMMPDLFPIDQSPDLNLTLATTIFNALGSTIPEQYKSQIYDFYFNGLSEMESVEIAKALSDFWGDYAFNCPMLFLGERMKRVYMYYVTYRSPKDPIAEWLGVPHFTEVPFVFGVPTIDDEQYTPEDAEFSESLMEKWISFAKTGYPTDDDTWPGFSASGKESFELYPMDSHVIDNPYKEACELLRDFFFSYQ